MTIAEVGNMLKSITGFTNKVAYYSFRESENIKLPIICYFTPNNRPFGADGKTYYSSNVFKIELYTKLKDETTEGLVEAKLNDNNIYYSKESTFLQDEDCWMTIYSIEV